MSTELMATLGLNALLLVLALAAWWLLRTGAAAERRRAERDRRPTASPAASGLAAEPAATPENPNAAAPSSLDPGWFSAAPGRAGPPPDRPRPPRPAPPAAGTPTSSPTRPNAALALRGRGVADLVRRLADGLVADGYGVRESSTPGSGWRADIVETFATDGGAAASGTVVGRISARWEEPWWLVDLALPTGRPERRLTTAAAEVGFRMRSLPDGDVAGRRGAEQVRIRRFDGG